MMDEIKKFLRQSVPGLGDEKLGEVVQVLEGHGFTSQEFLEEYLDPEADLKDCLNTVQRRILTAKLKQIKSDKATVQSTNAAAVLHTPPPTHQSTLSTPELLSLQPKPSTSRQTHLSPATQLQQDRSPYHDTNWVEKFQVPWDQCSDELLAACREKKQVPKTELLGFNRILGNAVRKITKKPGREALETICKKLCETYPATFGDSIPGYDDSIGNGYTTVLSRLQNFLGNQSRHKGPSSFRKRLYSAGKENVEGSEKRKKLAPSAYSKDQYGCANWQPDGLPDGETDQSQEESRLWMLNEFGKAHQDIDKVKSLMIATYATQRSHINQKDSCVSTFLEAWPFLQNGNILLNHFQTLMDFDLLAKLDEEYRKKSEDIISFPAESKKKRAREEAAKLMAHKEALQVPMPVEAGVLLLLPALLDEEASLLYKYTKDTVTGRDIESEDNIPHPHIVIAGDHPFQKNCFVVVEGCLVAAKEDFRKAVAVMFASFYCINLAYPENIGASLEFLQRIFAGINPGRGSKIEKGTKKRLPGKNKKVQQVWNDLKEYKNKWHV